MARERRTGTILKGIGGFYYVASGGTVVECKAGGRLRLGDRPPLAGDHVDIEISDGGDGFIVVMADKRRKQALKENVDYIRDVARENDTKVYDSMIRTSASATRLTKEDLFTPGTAASDDYAAFVKEFLKGE